MENSIWGVDSVAPAHQPVGGATGKLTFYDHLVAKGMKPDFFGRYLVAPKEQRLSKGEVRYLLDRGCRILPVFRAEIPTENSTLADGKSAAIKAITAAEALQMPGGVFIYADIEPDWKPSVDYLLGWCKEMMGSKYGGAGGFYCNNWSLSHFMRSYQKAFDSMAMPTKERMINLWCQHPAKTCSASAISFSPELPAFHKTGPVVWQYAINCLKFNLNGKPIGLIDMNLANQRGFDDMWGPSPSP